MKLAHPSSTNVTCFVKPPRHSSLPVERRRAWYQRRHGWTAGLYRPTYLRPAKVRALQIPDIKLYWLRLPADYRAGTVVCA